MKKPAQRDPDIHTRLPRPVFDTVSKLAEQERRTLSAMAALLIEDGLKVRDGKEKR